MNLKYIIYFLIIGLLFSCKPELDEFSYSSGSADFTTYVALGNSLTAGYADGSLYRSAQMNSYPAILAGQFMKVGGGAFTQPLMNGEYGILPGKLKLGYKTDCLGVTSLSPVPDEGQLDGMNSVGYSVNNLGVPGAKSFHLLADGYGNPAGIPVGLANPYFARFASTPNTSVLADAIAMSPSFFTLWIGNNDVLGFATSGGMADTITGQNSFAYFMNTILSTLTTATGAKGAIANIPDIVNVPFFTAVPPNGYVVTQGQADTLNMFLNVYDLQYAAGPNYFIVSDTTVPEHGFRQMVPGELLLLTVPQDSLQCAFWGGFDPVKQIPKPIPLQYYLSIDQINAIEAAVKGYNSTISNLASTYNLALVDFNAILKQIQKGVSSNGDTFTTEFITGNAFSLDGIHLTQKGYAFVANEFIKSINAKYGANVPMVSTTEYDGVALP